MSVSSHFAVAVVTSGFMSQVLRAWNRHALNDFACQFGEHSLSVSSVPPEAHAQLVQDIPERGNESRQFRQVRSIWKVPLIDCDERRHLVPEARVPEEVDEARILGVNIQSCQIEWTAS